MVSLPPSPSLRIEKEMLRALNQAETMSYPKNLQSPFPEYSKRG
jgi:hypothetical protein